MSIGCIDVAVLERGRRRQHDVGIERRVGQEAFVYDGEEVIAQKPFGHFLLVGRGAGRIRGVDEEALDGRLRGGGQGVADFTHVDEAHVFPQVGALHDVLAEGAAARHGGEEAAARLLPCADGGGQSEQESRRHRAVRIAREAAAKTYEGRARLAVGEGKFAYGLGRKSRDGSGAFWGMVRQDILFQFLPALDMRGEESLVCEALFFQHVEQCERECAVRARMHEEGAVSLACRCRLVCIDAPDYGAALFRHLHIVCEVDVRREHGETPEDDEIALLCFLRADGEGRSHDGIPAMTLCGGADRAVKLCRSECAKERVIGVVLQEPHRSCVGVGLYGLRAVLRDDFLPACGDLLHRFGPGNRAELACTLLSCALERREETARRMDGALVMCHFWTERAAREAVCGVAFDLSCQPTLDLDEKAAAIGTVVGTDRAQDFHDDSS